MADDVTADDEMGPYGDFDLKSRFQDISPEDVDNFVQQQRNKSTVRKTKGDTKVLHDWLKRNGDFRDMSEIPAQDLNIFLSRFFLSVRTLENNEYEPTTLRGMLSSFNRYLKEQKSSIDLIQDKDFHHCREVLQAKMKQLKSKGLGNRKNRAEPFSTEDVNLLKSKGLLGAGKKLSMLKIDKTHRS